MLRTVWFKHTKTIKNTDEDVMGFIEFISITACLSCSNEPRTVAKIMVIDARHVRLLLDEP
jgi:uncharacterized protein Smg (DUF494 family)